MTSIIPELALQTESDVTTGSHRSADTSVLSRTFVPGPQFEEEYAQARRMLSDFMRTQANLTARELGFGWVATVEAPSKFDVLVKAHAHSVRTGKPLPVSSEHCDTVMFTHPKHNHEFRFWHDTLHIRTGLTFQEDDEHELSLHHLKRAAKAGLDTTSLAYQMLATDLIGQNMLIAFSKDFAVHQEQFVRTCLFDGIHVGVVKEGKRIKALKATRDLSA